MNSPRTLVRLRDITRPHPRRYALRDRLSRLDADRDHEEVYRAQATIDLAWETRFGLNLALYRTFAVPRIAELLAATGEMTTNPHKRAFDTGLWMYELIEHGMDHERGREVVRGLNRMHRRYAIADEDYRYVLATFVVVPTRFIDDVGWRTSTAVEREAVAAFYARLGELMAIPEVPMGYDAFAALFDAYEAEHIAYSEAGAAQMRATSTVIAQALPDRLRWLAEPATSALLEPRLAAALGLRPPPPGLRALLRLALRARAVRERRRPPAEVGWFEPGRRGREVYPDGYEITDLGPDWLRQEPGTSRH